METKTIYLHVVCRIEKLTCKPAIFYRNEKKFLGNELSCYTREEQHSDACLDYYRQKTRPSQSIPEREACADLVRHYAQLVRKYEGHDLYIHSRLRGNT